MQENSPNTDILIPGDRNKVSTVKEARKDAVFLSRPIFSNFFFFFNRTSHCVSLQKQQKIVS